LAGFSYDFKSCLFNADFIFSIIVDRIRKLYRSYFTIPDVKLKKLKKNKTDKLETLKKYKNESIMTIDLFKTLNALCEMRTLIENKKAPELSTKKHKTEKFLGKKTKRKKNLNACNLKLNESNKKGIDINLRNESNRTSVGDELSLSDYDVSTSR
jgi:hypothetical protein